ncbi:hypothetical protein [Streptomyces glomeratus]|uniref:hypothetical protein n=1 Tax=Streptomyces glomeratus TaxID=284452 RepID=UPI001F1AF5C5|nr:hypothetical protein [Streptomyces glomeratus]MCF1510467.1 hypothetical protein [Streptomyces glomeratus]
MVEQLVQGGLVVAGAIEVGQILEDVGRQLAVVPGEVGGAVVDDDDAGRVLVGDVDERRGDLVPAELLGGGQVWLPARISLGRPVWVPRLTTMALYWPLTRSNSAMASTSPVRGLR